MNEEFILKLIEKFNESSAVSLKIKKDETELSLKKAKPCSVVSVPTAIPVAQNVVPSAPSVSEASVLTEKSVASEKKSTDSLDGIIIKSPIVGTFYRSPSADAPAYCEVGTIVKKGQAMCILEAMKMMNTLEAEFDCVVEEVLATSGDLVEYEQPLFRVKKA